MAFHPERLTGKRARQYRKSVDWTLAPVNAPKVLLQILKRPDLLRAWGRTRIADGTYHYVCLIRDRFVSPGHGFSAAQHRLVSQLVDALGGNPGAQCFACAEVLRKWKSPTDQQAAETLPAGLAAVLGRRRPSVAQTVKCVISESGNRRVDYTNPTQERYPHFARWEEPSDKSGSLYTDLTTPRSINGHKPASARTRIASLFHRTFRKAFGFRQLVVGVVDRSSGKEFGKESPGNTQIEVKYLSVKREYKLLFHFNVFNWYVRGYCRGRVVFDDHLILVPAKDSYPDSPVPCDAVSLSAIHQAMKNLTDRVSKLSTVTVDQVVQVPLTHGVLHRRDGGWTFSPSPCRNRVGSEGQLVPNLIPSRVRA